MKKTLYSVIATCLLLAALCGVCYAATFTPVIEAQNGTVGDTIEVKVSLPENTNAAGGSMNLVYDNTKMQLVEAKAGDLITAFSKTVNPEYAANKIRMNFAGSETVSSNGGVILVASFKLTGAGSASLSTEKFKLSDVDAKPLTCADTSKIITVTGSGSTVTAFAPVIEAHNGKVGDTIEVKVSLPANTNAAGGSMNLVYDNTKMQLVEAKAGDLITAFSKTVNPEYAANKIRMNFAGSETVSSSGGVILVASFKLTGAGSANISTEKFKLSDVDAKPLTCADTSKSITVSTGGSTVVSVTGVTLDKTTAEMTVGDTLSLTATVAPTNAANKNVTWSSNNEGVATVSNGTVTAVSAGTATITVTTADGGKTATCVVTVSAKSEPKPPVEADAVFTLGKVAGRPGDTVKVSLVLDNDKEINSIAIKNIGYDTNNLEFVGFEEDESFVANAVLYQFDEDNKAIIVGWMTVGEYSGKMCDIVFKIKDTALEGVYDITAESVVKNSSLEITSGVNDGAVTVTYQKLGDINLDDGLDINDAILLFQHSMMPEVYDIDYKGSLDFDGDGNVDIDDAILLFQHSMMPEIYPLG